MDDPTGGGDLDLAQIRARLLRYFYSEVGNRADAEDLAQDMIARYLHARQSNPVRNPEAYIWGSVQRLASRFMRKLKRERALMDSFDAAEMSQIIEFATADMRRETAMEELEDLRSKMKENWWRAICLREQEGLTVREIGTRLGVSESSAKTYLSKARAIRDQIARRG